MAKKSERWIDQQQSTRHPRLERQVQLWDVYEQKIAHTRNDTGGRGESEAESLARVGFSARVETKSRTSVCCDVMIRRQSAALPELMRAFTSRGRRQNNLVTLTSWKRILNKLRESLLTHEQLLSTLDHLRFRFVAARQALSKSHSKSIFVVCVAYYHNSNQPT